MEQSMDAQKRKRYDRQLRMWGEHGQEALERCKVCLLNGSASGTEVLKNLVLPGIGSFTVIDGSLVTQRDLGNNFFLNEASLGRSRAQCVTALLQELNEHVRGSYVHEDVVALLGTNPSFLDDFTIVIATQLPEATLRQLAAACAERSLPLVALRSYGLVGTVRVAAGEHVVREGHPDNPPSDLRACTPFPELLEFARSRYGHLESLSNGARKHVPYIVLLLHVLEHFKLAHGGALPASYKEKQAVKAALVQMGEGWFGVGSAEDATNFEEAKAAVNTALALPSVPASTKAVMAEAELRLKQHRLTPASHAGLSSASPTASELGLSLASGPLRTFWLLAAGLARFVAHEGEGRLPLLGTLPDMSSDTESYVVLANLYRDRAHAEAAMVHAHAQAAAVSVGLTEDAVTAEQSRHFCKSCHSSQFMRFRSIEDELSPQSARVATLAGLLDDGSHAPAGAFYLLLRAADLFHAQYNRWPGAMDDDIDADVPLLKQCVSQLAAELKPAQSSAGSSLAVRDDLVFEMCRYGAAEVHHVASIVGGVGSQEVIKLVTGQFAPLNNTFIYNGVNGTAVTAEL